MRAARAVEALHACCCLMDNRRLVLGGAMRRRLARRSEVLTPTVRRSDVIVLENLAATRSLAREMIERIGYGVVAECLVNQYGII